MKSRGVQGRIFVQTIIEKCATNICFENREVGIKKLAKCSSYQHEMFLYVYAFLCRLVFCKSVYLATFFISSIRRILTMLLAVSESLISITAMSHRTLFFLLQQFFANKDLQKFTNFMKRNDLYNLQKAPNFKLFLTFNVCIILTKVAKLHFSVSTLTKNQVKLISV